jgi:hypothetical protein
MVPVIDWPLFWLILAITAAVAACGLLMTVILIEVIQLSRKKPER